MIVRLTFFVLLFNLVDVGFCGGAGNENEATTDIINEPSNSAKTVDDKEETSTKEEKIMTDATEDDTTDTEDDDDKQVEPEKLKEIKFIHFKLINPLTPGDELVEMGDELLKRGDKKRALKCYNKAASKRNPKPIYFMKRANYYSEARDWSDAFSDIKNVLLLNEKLHGKDEIDRVEIDESTLANLGEKLHWSWKFEEAAWCYKEAIERNPEKLEYYDLLGKILLRAKKLPEAMSVYKIRKEKDPTIEEFVSLDHLFAAIIDSKEEIEGIIQELKFLLNDKEFAKLGGKFFNEEKYNESVLFYDQAIERNPENIEYYDERGTSLLKAKRLREAISNYKTQKEKDPLTEEFIDLNLLFTVMTEFEEPYEGILQDLCFLLNDKELVILGKKFSEIKENYVEATRYYSEAIEKNSAEISYYVLRGNSRLKIKELPGSLTDFGIVRGMNPEMRGFINSDFLFEAATDCEQQFRRYEQDWITCLSEADLELLGKKYHTIKKEHELAIHYYSEAIRKNPSDAEYYVLRGIVHLDKGDMNLAMTEFEEARRLDPSNRMIFHNVIKVLHQSQRTDELEEAVKVASDNDLIIIGREYMTTGKSELALWAFDEAIKKKSAATYHKFRALSHWKLRDHDKAIDDLRTSIKLDPRDISYKISLIEALIDKNATDEAKEEMSRLTYMSPLQKLGEKFAKDGRHNEAILCFDEYIRKNPEYCPTELRARAASFRALKKWNYAITDLNRAMSQSSIESYNKAMGRDVFEVLLESNDYKQAEEAINNYEKKWYMNEKESSWVAEARNKLKETMSTKN